MRTPLKLALACATLFAALTTSGLAEANAWRAEDDYTQVTATAPDHAGRPGVWQFMTQDPTSGTITPMPDFIASTGVDGVHVWETQAQGGLTALWGQNSSASDAVLAGTATVPAHAVFAHPSYYGDVAVLAWQNPLGMSIDVNVTGTITDFDPNGGNGVGWKLLNGTTTVLDSGSVAAPDSASDSIQGALQTTVPAGGKLYLVVDGSPTFSADDRAFDFDTTGIQLTIIQQHVAAGETWDLTSEWQDPHPRSANGAWSYGYQPAASTDVADITGMTDWVPLCFDGAATPGHGWTATNGVAWYENPKGADPVVECNSGVSIPARQLITSPASNGDKPTLTWTAASAGSVDVGGLVDDLDGGGGDGVDVTVKKVHGATVTPISSASATAPDAAEGTLTINTVAVDAGDKIILTVDPKGGYDYDTTGIRYGITPHTTTTGGGSGGGGSGSGDGGSTPTPQPPDPNVITLPFGMSITLQQLLGIDPATTNPANDPPKPIALDWYPYPSSKKRPATGYIDPTKQTPRTTVPNVTLRFWTMNDVMKDWQALSKQGIPIAVDFKPTSNPSFHNQPLLPGEVIGTDPSLSKQADSQPQTTTIANPFHITVSYFQPAPPPKAKVNKVKNPCKTVLAALPKGRAPYTAEYEAIVAKYKGSDCLITETRTKSTLTVAMATPHLDSPTNLRIAIEVPIQADLLVSVFPFSNAQAPTFDQNFNLPASPKRDPRTGAPIADGGTDQVGVSVVLPYAVGDKVGLPVKNVMIEAWYDPKGNVGPLHGSEAKLIGSRMTDADGVAKFGIQRQGPGQVTFVAMGHPIGPDVIGWTSRPFVVETTKCWVGADGWAFDLNGKVASCATKATANAAFTSDWKGLLCQLACWFVPGLDGWLGQKTTTNSIGTQSLAEPRTAPKAAPKPPCTVMPAESALNAPGINAPTPGTTTVGTVISSGGGNVISSGGGNVISSGGGNVISSGGGNIGTVSSRHVLDLGSDRVALTGLALCGGSNAIDVSTAISQPAPVISSGGGNVISSGGGNVIGQGPGNVISSGGGNVIGQGAGNFTVSADGTHVLQARLISQDGSSLISQDGSSVIANGHGNVISSGGGNVISSGGGNVISSGGGN